MTEVKGNHKIRLVKLAGSRGGVVHFTKDGLTLRKNRQSGSACAGQRVKGNSPPKTLGTQSQTSTLSICLSICLCTHIHYQILTCCQGPVVMQLFKLHSKTRQIVLRTQLCQADKSIKVT